MKIQRLLLTGAILLGMAVPAAAQIGFQLSFGGRHHKNSFQISIGTHPRAPRHVHVRRGFRYVTRRVWVPGCERRILVPARYGYRYDVCGRRVRYCIVPAHYEIVREPGRWEYRRERVRVGRRGRHGRH
jgi:hypothetical protein